MSHGPSTAGRLPLPAPRRRPDTVVPEHRPGLLAAALLAAATAVVVLTFHGDDRARLLFLLTRTVALVATAALLRRRHRRTDPEARVWSSFVTATTVLAVGSAVDVGVRIAVVPVPRELMMSGRLFGIAVVVACALVYRGLLDWNRVRTVTASPADWHTGVAALCAAMAVGNLAALPALSDLDGYTTTDWLWLQLNLLELGALLVVVGTTATVAVLARFHTDARPWLLVAGGTALLLGKTTWFVVTTPAAGLTALGAGWSGFLVCLLVAGRLRRVDVHPRPARVRDLVLGSLFISGVAVSTLVVTSRLDPHWTTTAVTWAVLSVAFVSLRVGELVRGLTGLAQTHQEADTDRLTGLGNRNALRARLDRAVADVHGVALVVLDVDRFQEINDRFGHSAGDDVLRDLAARLQAACPGAGLLTRLGSDEFALVLPRAEAADAVAVAGDLQEICRAGTVLDGRRVRLSSNVGIAVSGGCEERVPGEELLRRADVAAATARDTAGGIAVYDADVDRAGRSRALLADDLALAIGPDADPDGAQQFEVHYQPQLSTRTGEVLGVEALVRWNHPDLGLLGATQFLDIVEERGYMRALTAHVARTAGADLARWQDLGLRLRVSINTSATCLTVPHLTDLLDEIVATGIAPWNLVVEVTETTLARDPARALAVCRRLVESGVGVSIDDFGTGYSSLGHLADLSATELKIDYGFTSRVATDERVEAIVAGTVELAHRLGLRTVAEGVEDTETLAVLRRLGCDESQGFLHAHPLRSADLLRWLGVGRLSPVRP